MNAPGFKLLSAALVLSVLCVLSSCSQPAQQPDAEQKLAEVEAKAAKCPSLWKAVDGLLTLGAAAVDEVVQYIAKLNRRQELQATVRHWLIVGAVASGLFALLAGAGKFCSNVPAWWGVILRWIAEQVRWRAIVGAALACAACICMAVWIAPLWRFGIDLLHVAGYLLVFCAGWEFSCRRYTGAWKPDGLVRLPKGWQVAPPAAGPVNN